jgi:hypothetical protein
MKKKAFYVFMVLLLILPGCYAPASNSAAEKTLAETSPADVVKPSAQVPAAASTKSTPSGDASAKTSAAASGETCADVLLPAPEQGEWYEWDKAGSYPANLSHTQGGLLYIEAMELFIRTQTDSDDRIVLKTRAPEGGEIRILDDDVAGPFDYFDGWVYYAKGSGIYKIRPDGTEKHKITEDEDEKNISAIQDEMVMVYDGRVYLDAIASVDLEGKDFVRRRIPDVPIGTNFIEKGNFYYAAIEDGEQGGDCWSIYRYNLRTGACKELTRSAFGPLVVQDGWVYYYATEGLVRNDGKKTQALWPDADIDTFYRNYMLYEYAPENGVETCYAQDSRTGKNYGLFPIPDYNEMCYNIAVSENNIFLYDGNAESPIYRITADGDMAKITQLPGF